MAPTEPDQLAVCDAGPLIHLHELDCLDLLSDLGPVLIPDIVWLEVERHRPNALSSLPFQAQRLRVELSSSREFQTLIQSLSLDHGEQASLSLMATHRRAILLTDDAAARLAGKMLGYRVHGTLGVILRAFRVGQRDRDTVLRLLRDLPERSTLFLRRDLLEEAITQVRQMP